MPRLTKTQRDAISSPAVGLQIFNSEDGWVEYYDTFWGWMPVNFQNMWRSRYGYDYFQDFGAAGGSINDGTLTLSSAGSGAGGAAQASLTLATNRPTIIAPTTGTTTTGRAQYGTEISFTGGGGLLVYEQDVYIPTLYSATEAYSMVLGFIRNTTSPTATDGIYFLYDSAGTATGSTATAKWQCVTANNSSRTYTTTTTNVPEATWTKLRIELNAAGTSAVFKIDGVTVHTETTNIPTGTSRPFSVRFGIIKSAGTTARLFQSDYISIRQKFTTSK